MLPTWKLVLFLAYFVCISCAKDFYSFNVIDADGKTVSLEKYRGQVTLIVNVASECRFTDGHYKALVNTKNLLKSTGKFEILAFPCNQFAGHEPKDINDILEFARTKYNVNFPIFAKLNVYGDDVADIYRYLQEKTGRAPDWNFWKYLINHKGEVIGFWGPWTDVQETFPSIRSAVEMAITEDKQPKMPAQQAMPPPPPYTDSDMPRRQPVSAESAFTSAAPPQPPKAPVAPPPPVDRSRFQPSGQGPRPPQPAPDMRGAGRTPAPKPPARKHEDL